MSIKHVVCFYWIIFSSWSHLFKLLNISKDLTSDYLFIIYNKSDFYPIFQSTAAAKSLQSCLTLCDLIDGSPPGSSVPGILQARTLEWVAIAFSSACMHAKSLQSCPTLCSLMDSSSPGSSVHRILQARILKWVAISFSIFQSRNLTMSNIVIYINNIFCWKYR